MIYVRDDLRPLFASERSLDDFLAIEGEMVKHVVSSRRTARFQRDGKSFYIKSHWGVGWKEIFKNLTSFRLPIVSAENELQAIRVFERLHLDTMNVAAFGRSGLNPAKIKSFIITDALKNTESLETWTPKFLKQELTPARVKLKRALINKIAEISRRMHQGGINHRDYYICHLLLDISKVARSLNPDDIRIYVIDLHRAQHRFYTPKRWLVKDLAGIFFSSMDLALTNRDLYRFMQTYSGKRMRDIMKDESAFWDKVKKRAMKLYISQHKKSPARCTRMSTS